MRLTPPPTNPFASFIKLALALVLLAGACGVSFFWLFYRHIPDPVPVSNLRTPVLNHATAARNHETPISNHGPFESGQNSIGMKFVEIPGTGNYWSIWETRVGDFKRFIEEHPEKSPGQMFSLVGDSENPWRDKGYTWKDPGFAQTDEHPVVGVSFEDAQAFCDWLNQKERAQLTKYHYRLPTVEEWRIAAAYQGIYPWGNDWPGPLSEGKRIGNYAGSEAKGQDWPGDFTIIAPTYNDGFPRTAPAGSFAANRYGLFDMDGNVSEWCSTNADDNASIVACGGSWCSGKAEELELKHEENPSNERASYIGFRVIAAPSN
jgi:hypothetical protein